MPVNANTDYHFTHIRVANQMFCQRSNAIFLLLVIQLVSAQTFGHEVAKIKLEEPVDGGIASGITNVRGWVVSDSGVERVELFVNGQYLSDIPYGGHRPDVEQTFPEVMDSINSGFGQTFNYGELGAGQHEITVRAYLGDGLLIEDSSNFVASVLPSPYLPESEKPDLSGASVSLDRTTGEISISNVMVEADEPLDIRLAWSTAMQGFGIIEIDSSVADSVPSGAVMFMDGDGTILGEAQDYADCTVGQFAKSVLPTLEYTPLAKIRNASYPVTLEQAP